MPNDHLTPAQRGQITARLWAAGWPSVAEDIRDGVPTEQVVTNLLALDEESPGEYQEAVEIILSVDPTADSRVLA